MDRSGAYLVGDHEARDSIAGVGDRKIVSCCGGRLVCHGQAGLAME
jgi:hypothetical protein